LSNLTLEIGCGTHVTSNVHIAIDLEKCYARDIQADAHVLPFKDNVFHTVFMFEVLEHLESPIKTIKEVKRVLKNNGELIISIPNVMYFRHILRWVFKGIKNSVSPGHIYTWTLSELDNLLTITGFRIIEVDFTDMERHHKTSIFAQILPRITKHSVVIKAKSTRFIKSI